MSILEVRREHKEVEGDPHIRSRRRQLHREVADVAMLEGVMAKEIHENAPGSKLVMIPNAAHLANLENPAPFTRAMQEFLAAN
jgi:flagellar biosynthesis protein FlhB